MISKDFKPSILRFDELPSTNTKLKELALQGTAAEGTVVVAKRQTAGRGRGGRTWLSPEGGLYFSTLLIPKGKHITDLPILAGIALTQGIKQCLPKSVEVGVKWPNDCLVNWKKAAGILCEAVMAPGMMAAVVGIGVNVNLNEQALAEFQKNPFQATSFELTGGSTFEVEPVFQTIVKKLFTLYQLYQEQGFQPIQYLWEKNCQFIGKKIELRESGWRDNPVKPSEGEMGVTTGTMLGIDEQGALVLSNARGERHSYVSGEITAFWP